MKGVWLDAGLFYCSAVWGSTFIFQKAALAGAGPALMVSCRFLLAAILIAPFALRRPSIRAGLRDAAVLAVLLAVLYVAQTAGLKYTSAANSGFITGLFVAFVPLLLPLFSAERADRWQWLAVGVSLAGLWALTGGLSGLNRGDVLTVLCAATYAAHLLATDRFVKGDADVIALAFHQFWMAGVICFAMALAFGEPLRVTGWKPTAIIVFLAVLPTLSAFYIQMTAQQTVSPIRCSLIFALEPVFAALFAWTLGGESMSASQAAGGALIVGAMLLGEAGKLPMLRKAAA